MDRLEKECRQDTCTWIGFLRPHTEPRRKRGSQVAFENTVFHDSPGFWQHRIPVRSMQRRAYGIDFDPCEGANTCFWPAEPESKG